MPSQIINSVNINTFSYTATFDFYNKVINFSFANTTYNNGSTSGIMFVQGISVSVVDGVGLPLAVIDFTNTNNYIVPAVTQLLSVPLMGSVAFFAQPYTIIAAIKDQNGTIYQTIPVYPNVCSVVGINEDGYVDGMFQVTANCANNTLSVSEVTLLVYNSQQPSTVTKNGTLYYPSGTISPVTFTGTPFANNVVYTGQYRIYNTTVGTYDISNGNGIYVAVTYITDNVFDIQCGSKMNDLFCCIESIQRTAIKNCNNAIGAQARQQLLEISTYFMGGILAEIVGQDASFQYNYIKQALNCNCGANSIRQNELNPINPSVYSILVVGSNNTTVTPSQNGSTKTYTVSSPYYVVSKGITGDLAFTITQVTTVANTINYQITFNYAVMASYILTAIGASPTLIAQLNSLVAATTNIDLTDLNGMCVINLSNINYFLSFITPNAASTFNSITFGATNYTPGSPILCSNVSGVLAYINGLGLGTFTASYSNGYFNLLTNSNANNPVSVTLVINAAPVVVPFQKTNFSLIAVLQAIINYLCNITALQVALGNNLLSLCYFDYNGNIVTQTFTPLQKQNDFNAGISAAICNIVSRINTLTGVTCATIKNLFPVNPNAVFNNASDGYLASVGGNCTMLSGQQQALAFINAINTFSNVKAAFCAISCTTPATCPDVAGTSLQPISNTSIGLYGLTWGSTTTATQTVTVKYQLSGSSSWITATNSLLILPNGSISGTTPFVISGLVSGDTYSVWVQNNCGGNGFINQITVPTQSVYQGAYLLDTSLYNICGDTPVTLYSGLPFATGVEMFYDAGLSNKVTGYYFIAPVSTGVIYNFGVASAIVGSTTGSDCTSGTAGSYILGNSTATICTGAPVTLYTNGVFAVGGTLYTNSALTTPQEGYSYVVDGANNHIYNVNSSTGQIISDTGLTCNSNYTVSAAYNLNITNVLGTGIPNLGVINSGQSKSGFQTGLSGNIQVTLTGTVITASKLDLYKNSILQQCIAVPSTGTYTFTGISAASTDQILISVDSGSC